MRRRELGGECVEPGGIPSDEHEIVAAAGELASELGAETGARSGDEGDGHPETLPRSPAPGRT